MRSRCKVVREQIAGYVGNNVGTKGEGRRGRPIGKVLVHRWLLECHQQKQQVVMTE